MRACFSAPDSEISFAHARVEATDGWRSPRLDHLSPKVSQAEQNGEKLADESIVGDSRMTATQKNLALVAKVKLNVTKRPFIDCKQSLEDRC